MAAGTPLSGKKFLVQLGDGGSPTEAFDEPCGLTTRGIAFTKATSETVMPDCDDADVVPFVTREAISRSVTVSGSGKVARESLAAWRQFWEDEGTRNCRFVVPGTGAQGGGRWQGAWHLSSFSVTAVYGESADIEIEMVSSGNMPWTAAA